MIKNKTAIKLFFLLLAAAGLIGLILYYVLKPEKVVALILPELKEINHLYINVRNDSIAVKMYAVVQNTNPYKLTMDTFHFELRLHGTKLATETVPLMLRQSKGDMDTIKIPVHFSLKKIAETITVLEDSDSTEVELESYMIYNTIIGKYKVKNLTKKRIAVPIPPEIKVLKIEQAKFNIADKSAEAIIKLQIRNKGKYLDFELNDTYFNIRIQNTLSSKGFVDKVIKIKPGSEVIVDIPALIEYDHPVKTALDVLFNDDKVDYEIALKSLLKISNFEDTKRIPVEVYGTGKTEFKTRK